MKNLKLFCLISNFVFILLFWSCGPNNQDNSASKGDTNISEENKSKPENIQLDLEDPNWQEKIIIKASGLNTYKQVSISVRNKTQDIIELNLKSGLFFVNPSSNQQSLITLESVDNITIQPNATFSKNIISACTNSGKGTPDASTAWPNEVAPKNLDKGIIFYDKNKDLIVNYLKKKNPERYSTEEDQQAFLQVVIWTYLDNDYNDIITFLTTEVYGGNSNNAKSFLDEVYEVAQEMARLIRDTDQQALVTWVKEKSKELLNKTRDRFRLN